MIAAPTFEAAGLLRIEQRYSDTTTPPVRYRAYAR
jgi:hypothetical protein